MRKPLPADTWDNLFYPPPDYRYFENCAQHDFEPNAPEYSWVNAWWLADAALLAYVKDWNAVVEFLLAARFDEKVTQIGRDPAKSTKGFFASRSGPTPFAILAFRGTDKDDLRNLLTDLDTVPESVDRYIVHKGFAHALDQVWEGEVTPAINGFLHLHPGAPVYFTGHSLGAALATISVARFNGTNCALYTIGSPRVGDDQFVRAVRQKTDRIFRFVNCQDIVTLVPPEIALRHYFRHVGIEEYFDRHGVLHEHPSELMKAADVVPGVLDHDGAALLKEITNPLDFLTQCLKGNLVNPPAFLIGNHSPARYPILIWNYYTAA